MKAFRPRAGSGNEAAREYYDEAISVSGLLIEIAKSEHAGADVHVIACFNDARRGALRGFS